MQMNPMDTINMFCSDDFLKSVPGLAKEKEVDSSLPVPVKSSETISSPKDDRNGSTTTLSQCDGDAGDLDDESKRKRRKTSEDDDQNCLQEDGKLVVDDSGEEESRVDDKNTNEVLQASAKVPETNFKKEDESSLKHEVDISDVTEFSTSKSYPFKKTIELILSMAPSNLVIQGMIKTFKSKASKSRFNVSVVQFEDLEKHQQARLVVQRSNCTRGTKPSNIDCEITDEFFKKSDVTQIETVSNLIYTLGTVQKLFEIYDKIMLNPSFLPSASSSSSSSSTEHALFETDDSYKEKHLKILESLSKSWIRTAKITRNVLSTPFISSNIGKFPLSRTARDKVTALQSILEEKSLEQNTLTLSASISTIDERVNEFVEAFALSSSVGLFFIPDMSNPHDVFHLWGNVYTAPVNLKDQKYNILSTDLNCCPYCLNHLEVLTQQHEDLVELKETVESMKEIVGIIPLIKSLVEAIPSMKEQISKLSSSKCIPEED